MKEFSPTMKTNSTVQDRIYYAIDIVLFLFCSYSAYLFCYSFHDGSFHLQFPWLIEYSIIFALQLTIMIALFRQRRLYNTDRQLNYSDDVFSVLSGLLVTALLSAVIIYLSKLGFFSRLIFGIEFVSLFFLLSGWRVAKRYFLRRLIARGFRNLNMLLAGFDGTAASLVNHYLGNRQLGINIIGYLNDCEVDNNIGLPRLGGFDDLEKVCHTHFVEEVIVLGSVSTATCSDMINRATAMGLGVGTVPNGSELLPPVIMLEGHGDVPLLRYQFKSGTPLDSLAKRVLDILLSAVALVVLAPLFALIALLVKFSSSGPVFFSQKRVGVKGKEFAFYKFRSMVVNAEELRQQLDEFNEVKDGVIFKMKNDPRITPIGRFLRKYSLDELPQLFNVLKGDMSIVGPRPPLMSEVTQYHHEQMMRLKVRPGLTGLPQIRGRSNLPFSEWVKWDLWYIRNWSLWLDVKIVFATIPAILSGDGAY